MIGPPRRAIGPIALGAVALAASYPPFNLPILSFVALAPAVLLVRQSVREEDPLGAFRIGWWYGLAANALVLYWLIVALWHFTPLSALGYLGTILIEATWIGALFWFTVRVRLRAPRVPLWVVFPVAWTAVEWAIGHQGDIRFPWLGLGTSLADAPVLVQWADLVGARGITAWLVWCNVLLVEALLPPVGVARAMWRRLVPVLASIIVVAAYGFWREATLVTRPVGLIGLVQPNEGFWEKWRPEHEDSVVARLISMTRSLHQRDRLDLVVWPEAAVPGYFVNHPEWDRAVATLAREERLPILTGGLDAEFHPDRTYDYFNAAFYYDSTGNRNAWPSYHKHELVPVVERVPFINPGWIHLQWFGGFGKGRGFPLYGPAERRFGVLICYESIFEYMARAYRAAGADYLVNITNDAWYGRTSAPYQHASHLVLRAIETRMGIARAANSGISEFVDPLGHAYSATRLETRTLVADRLRTSDVITPYVRAGDWVGVSSMLATLGFAGLLVRPRRRNKPDTGGAQ
ncbi:MAG TPA: apolipoprotein N-acyltransferase [Gemmatimonadales bacterium]|nr:apolipoprotein N-acyltransferase [Gemmatimonadales bacterium]